MKTLMTFAAVALSATLLNAQIYMGEKSKIEFFSYTPVENISAKSTSVTTVVNFGTNDFVFQVKMRTFDFPNDQMEEHFNENYLESKKYPEASYKGKITSPAKIDVTKDGTYNVTTEGDLTIHGVAKKRTIPAVVTVKGGKATISANFTVKLVDHGIKVPDMVVTKIAEEIKVSISATLKKT